MINGIIICPSCNGKGYISEFTEGIIAMSCTNCLGFGEITWLDEILGKHKNIIRFHYRDGTTEDRPYTSSKGAIVNDR